MRSNGPQFKWYWMNRKDVMGLVAARAQRVLKQLEVNDEADFGTMSPPYVP
jgi:hypothetical protein